MLLLYDRVLFFVLLQTKFPTIGEQRQGAELLNSWAFKCSYSSSNNSHTGTQQH